jgi:hypothetical protein
MNVMRLGGAVTMVAMGSLLGAMFLRERRRKRSDSSTRGVVLRAGGRTEPMSRGAI